MILQRNRFSQLVFVVMVNVVLFGVTPFLNCGGPSPQEQSAQDASTTTDGSTGQVTPEPSNGPEPESADWPKPNTPYENPKGATPSNSFDAKAQGFSVESASEDKQICVVLDAPTTEDQLLHRFEPIEANPSMVQRVILSIDDGDKKEKDAWDCSADDPSKEKLTPLFVWVSGAAAFQFPDKAGVLLPKGKRLRLTFVVRNDSGSPVELKSGIKVFPIATGGKEYKLWSNPVSDISIQPGVPQRLSSLCVFKQPATLLAGLPMMGKLGTQFISEIVRQDGSREELMYVDVWSPDKYLKMFSFPFSAKVGDTLSTSCAWNNKGDKEVKQGWRSSDEQCDLMVYIDAQTTVTKDLCSNDPTKPTYKPPPINFKPGKCASKDGLATAKDIPLKAGLGSELDVDFGLKGGEWIEANWELQGGEVIFKSALIGTLMRTEFTTAAGQIRTGSTFFIDFVIQAVINLGDRTVEYPFPISANGTFKAGAKAGEFSVDVKCGDFDHKNFTYEIDGDTLQIGGVIKAQTQAGPIDYSLKLKFVKK